VYVSGKMITAEIIPRMREGVKRMMEEMNSSMIYLMYCKNFCKCHMFLHPENNTKLKIKEEKV
jgi:hypothetical protein